MKADATDLFQTTITSEIDESLVEAARPAKQYSFSSSTTGGSADEGGHGHYGRGGGGGSSGNKSSSNTMLALIAKREQNAVFYSRVVVVIVMFVAMSVLSGVMFSLITKSERNNFETQVSQRCATRSSMDRPSCLYRSLCVCIPPHIPSLTCFLPL